jgi:hypothetical protein
MLWTQYSATLANFQRKIGVFLKVRCHDPIFWEKTSNILNKNYNFSAIFLNLNIHPGFKNNRIILCMYINGMFVGMYVCRSGAWRKYWWKCIPTSFPTTCSPRTTWLKKITVR